ncbi:hypothetical protein HNP84_003083 [Thermocatellispora tengchongensis]|uniref:Uncharacterized protein n=1 Tax=Thermocatellispora tengchongensis TaxID=1073253 RepID=A0A840P816_9ACTN|nr:hypothetical protein [Thermocatellispora tengchongensis]MBB5133357.1 hypothetical protein [Thermocatellispora tengchongensis]
MHMFTSAALGMARRTWVRVAAAVAVALGAGLLVAGNAAPAQAAPPEVISRWNNHRVHTGSLLNLNNFTGFSGKYTITAKTHAHNTGNSTINYTCTLSAEGGADTDFTEVTLGPGAKESIVVHVVHDFTGTGMLAFGCTKPAGTATVNLNQIKLTAIKVNTLDNQPF